PRPPPPPPLPYTTLFRSSRAGVPREQRSETLQHCIEHHGMNDVIRLTQVRLDLKARDVRPERERPHRAKIGPELDSVLSQRLEEGFGTGIPEVGAIVP